MNADIINSLYFSRHYCNRVAERIGIKGNHAIIEWTKKVLSDSYVTGFSKKNKNIQKRRSRNIVMVVDVDEKRVITAYRANKKFCERQCKRDYRIEF